MTDADENENARLHFSITSPAAFTAFALNGGDEEVKLAVIGAAVI